MASNRYKNKPWSRGDKAGLASMVKAGKYTWADIGRALDREADECSCKAKEMGLEKKLYATKPQQTLADKMPDRATAELIHANGKLVSYA